VMTAYDTLSSTELGTIGTTSLAKRFRQAAFLACTTPAWSTARCGSWLSAIVAPTASPSMWTPTRPWSAPLCCPTTKRASPRWSLTPSASS